MIKILFIRNPKAYLPEINAYIQYFNNLEGFIAYDSGEIINLNYDEFDVIWQFMGTSRINLSAHQLLVHEYASVSTGKFPKVKNLIKSNFNQKPDIRIFLNEKVEGEFNFKDKVATTYRDMGIDELFLRTNREIEKKFDIVYVGVIGSSRGMDVFLANFTKDPYGSLLLIGDADEELLIKYKNHPNITFTGRVPYDEVPSLASQAKYGLNYIPDKYPFNIQTSTKLLEYLGMGLGVITTKYKWVHDFKEEYDLDFIYINDLNIDYEIRNKIANYNPLIQNQIDMSNYLWKNIIDQSRIKDMILEKYMAKNRS